MKIMFVCRSNTGRSQVAEALYNKITQSKNAISTGTIVKDGIKTVGEKSATDLIAAMKMRSIDISSNERTQISKDMVEDVDKVIVMAEPENIPDWLKNIKQYEYWKIEDIKGKNLEDSVSIINRIELKVKELINKN